MHHWAFATQGENRADHRPVLRYHYGPDHRSCTAACRWRAAYAWHDRYVHAVAQRPLRPPLVWPINHRSIWLCIHPKESVDWYLDSLYDGGLQFRPATWRAAGGTVYAPYAYMATPDEQMSVAEHLIYDMGASYATQWPNTSPGCV